MTRIFARPVPVPNLPADLVCVELPANCAVDGGMSEFRRMLQDAVAIAYARGRNEFPVRDFYRLQEIEAWLAGEGP